MVHVSQFYPCSRVSTACELYYICELGKYLQYEHNDALSIDGVILDKALRDSIVWDYFRIALTKGWVLESGLSVYDYEINVQYDLDYDRIEASRLCNVLLTLDEVPFDSIDNSKRKNDLSYAIMTPERRQVGFVTNENGDWLWSVTGCPCNSKIVGNGAKFVVASLIAYVAVHRLKFGSPSLFCMIVNDSLALCNMAITYLELLSDCTSALHGWCFYSFDKTVSEENIKQLGYMSWYTKGKDMGYLERYYTATEKLKCLKENDIRAGDVVWWYKRNYEQVSNFVKTIASCRLAIVREITSSGIKLQAINTVKLYQHGKRDYADLTMAVKQMYGGNKPFEKLNTSTTVVDFTDLGVHYLLYDELNFIVRVDEAEDYCISYISNGTQEFKVRLPQLEYIYWLLMEYHAEFNIEHYKALYLSEKPLYETFIETGTVDSVYLCD